MQSKIDLRPNQTIVFIGDSITDADRYEPAYRPFGFGYVHFVANYLLAKYPELNLNIVNTDDRKLIEKQGISRGVYINGKPFIKRMASWEETKPEIDKYYKKHT